MSADSLDVKELASSLKKLILGYSVLQNVSSMDEAQQAFLQMEEFDENFHRYAFVKMLRNCIEETVGPLVDEEIQKHSSGTNELAFGQDTTINKITSKLLESQAFIGLSDDIKKMVATACEELLNNYDREFPQVPGFIPSDVGKKPENHFYDGDSSVGGSSSSHSTAFYNSETLQQEAINLNKKNTLEVRKMALKNLEHLTGLLDVQNDVWKSVRIGLIDALSESDDELWLNALKVIARGFGSNNNCSIAMYKTLVEFLSSQFAPGSKAAGLLPKTKQGLDCRNTHVTKLLRGFRLMNDFLHQIPQRCQERYLEEVLEATLGFFALPQNITSQGVACLSPLQFFAVLDPKAGWFVKLMHGHFSRLRLLKLLEKHASPVENAVSCFMEYRNSLKRRTQDAQNTDAHKMFYTSSQLEFSFFIQCLSIFSRLLLFEQGRNFFPVVLRNEDDPVTLTRLLVALIEFISSQQPLSLLPAAILEENAFDPCELVKEILKKLCMSEDICQKCICQDAVTTALLAPIKQRLDGPWDKFNSQQVSDFAMVHVADLLSSLASSECGRKHLLSGNKENPQELDPIHVLAEFAKKSIEKELPSKAIIGNIIFVCRQIYSTCFGLFVLKDYRLHEVIYAEWRAASREAENAATPTPASGDSPSKESPSKILWEETLRDNLLNFACTAKGLLQLQQTGALTECVSYMYSRYVRKLQVSKCEKFGYGYMMSQIAATAPGIRALQDAGFIATIVRSIWGVLEVVDDNPVFTPKPWSVNPIDKTSKKPFTNLITLLSSALSVYEILTKQVLPTKSEYTVRQSPDTIVGLLDRLVFVDTSIKITSLFNYEQSHVFGLRLLSVMTCCLDTLLLLNTQYNFQDMLLSCQAQNIIENGKEIIFDMLSLERNYILVKTFTVGGPSERVIPPRTLQMGSNARFPYRLFSSYPIPNEYLPNIPTKTSTKDDSELHRFLADTKKETPTSSWLEKCQKAFLRVLSSRPEQVYGSGLFDALERVVAVNSQTSQEAIFSTSDYSVTDAAVKNYMLTPIQMQGIELAIRYGCHLRLFSSAKDAKEKLTLLVKKCTIYLQHQQMHCTANTLQCLEGSSVVGFDWYVATVFLMTGGSADRSWKFLFKFSSMVTSAYVWMQRIHCSVHLPESLVRSGIPPVFSVTCHSIELILQADLPHVYSTFKMSGYSPAQICQHWIRQCFWNYLDFPQICHYIALCLILGSDYQVYLCVAILRHLHRELMQQMQDKNLIVFIKEEPIRGFQVEQYMNYMQQLEKKFRHIILTDMQNIAKP